MSTKRKPTPAKISGMSVSELVALINETNKPPGGIAALHEIATHSFITRESKVLEVGCNTGYSSIELSRLTGAKVVGIDVVADSIQHARKKAEKENLNIDFLVMDATKMTFRREFDLVLCSNATSFMENKGQAIKGYKNALKPYGLLAAIPLYYVKEPPQDMLDALSKEIGVNVKPLTRDSWSKLFEDQGLELCYEKRFSFEHRTDKEISDYIRTNYTDPERKPLLRGFSDETRGALYGRYFEQYKLFNRNLQYMNASILIYRKVPETYEKELFRLR